MRSFHSYHGAIGGIVLFALAAQAGRAEESAHQANSPPPTLQPAANANTSTRWAGYGVVNKVTGPFLSVFGSQWNVPVVRYVPYPQSPNATYEQVSVWTGIGGNNPDLSPLIQAGTTSQVDQSVVQCTAPGMNWSPKGEAGRLYRLPIA